MRCLQLELGGLRSANETLVVVPGHTYNNTQSTMTIYTYNLTAVAGSGGAMPKELAVMGSIKTGKEKRWLRTAHLKDGFCYLALFKRRERRGVSGVLGPNPLVETLMALRSWWSEAARCVRRQDTAATSSGVVTRAHLFAADPRTAKRWAPQTIGVKNGNPLHGLHKYTKVGSFLLPRILAGTTQSTSVPIVEGLEARITVTMQAPSGPSVSDTGENSAEFIDSSGCGADASGQTRLLRHVKVVELVRVLSEGSAGMQADFSGRSIRGFPLGAEVCPVCERVKFNVASLLNTSVIDYVKNFQFYGVDGSPVTANLFSGVVTPGHATRAGFVNDSAAPGLVPGRPVSGDAFAPLRAVTYVLPFFCTGVYRLFRHPAKPMIPTEGLLHAGNEFTSLWSAFCIGYRGLSQRPNACVKRGEVSPAGQIPIPRAAPVIRPISRPLCEHMQTGDQALATKQTTKLRQVDDGFGAAAMDPKNAYRGHEHCNGTRCYRCNPTVIHGMFPEVAEACMTGSLIGRQGNGLRRSTVEMGMAMAVVTQGFPRGCTAYITATSQDRAEDWATGLPGGFTLYIVLVPDDATYAMVNAMGDNYEAILVPVLGGNNRALTMWRLTALATLPIGWTGVLGNGRVDLVYPTDMSWLPLADGEALNPVTWNVYPPCGACFAAAGGAVHGPFLYGEAPWDAALLVYGADEVALTVEDALHDWSITGPWNGLSNLTPGFHHNAPVRFRLKGPVGTRYIHYPYVNRAVLREVLRQSVKMHARPRRPTFVDALWSTWDDKDCGVFRELPTGAISSVKAASVPSSSASGIIRELLGPVLWAPFGSRGDIVPPRALAKHLSRMGVDVYWMPLCSEDEGQQLLRDLESGHTLRGSAVYLRAAATLAAATCTTVSITELPMATATYSLQPPRSAIAMPRFAMGRAFDIVMASFFGSSSASFNIGAYAGATWVPRSHDGETFLRVVSNTGQKPAGLAWGSSSLPKPILPGVEDVPAGDHMELFRQYRKIYTHGGAGTVQTAAACGCVVEVCSDMLDRRYLIPTNAGAGLTFGLSPDRVLLGLARHEPLLYLLYAKRGWTHALDALWWWLAASGQRYIWGSIALAWALSSSLWYAQVGPTPFATLVALVLGDFLGDTLVGVIVSPLIGQVAEAMSDALGVDRVEVVRRVAEFVLTESTSAVGLTLILRSGLVRAVIITAGLRSLRPSLRAIAAMAMGAASLPPAGHDERYATLRLNLVLSGWVPVVHAGLTSPDGTEVYELRFTGTNGWIGGQAVIGMYPNRAVEGVVLNLGTLLPWSEVRTLPTVRGSYSPFFNCQVTLVQYLGPLLPLLGVGGFALWVSALIAASTIAFIVLVVGVPIALILTMPDLFAFGLPFIDEGSLSTLMHTWSYMYARLSRTDLPILSRLLSLANVTATGFGQSILVDPHGYRLIQDFSRNSLDLTAIDRLGYTRTELVPKMHPAIEGFGHTVLAVERWMVDAVAQQWGDLVLDSGRTVATRAITHVAVDAAHHALGGAYSAMQWYLAISLSAGGTPDPTLNGTLTEAILDLHAKYLDEPQTSDNTRWARREDRAKALEAMSAVVHIATTPTVVKHVPWESVPTSTWRMPTGFSIESVERALNITDPLTPRSDWEAPILERRLAVAVLLGPNAVRGVLWNPPRYDEAQGSTVLTPDESASLCQCIYALVKHGAAGIPTVRTVLDGTNSRRVTCVALDFACVYLHYADAFEGVDRNSEMGAPLYDDHLEQLCAIACAYLALAGYEIPDGMERDNICVDPEATVQYPVFHLKEGLDTGATMTCAFVTVVDEDGDMAWTLSGPFGPASAGEEPCWVSEHVPPEVQQGMGGVYTSSILADQWSLFLSDAITIGYAEANNKRVSAYTDSYEALLETMGWK
jgi:hypothetical protein